MQKRLHLNFESITPIYTNVLIIGCYSNIKTKYVQSYANLIFHVIFIGDANE